jgi:rhodanese-related sulfurtransferase
MSQQPQPIIPKPLDRFDQELQELLIDESRAEGIQFVDVREPGEYDAAALPRFKLFPLSQAAK